MVAREHAGRFNLGSLTPPLAVAGMGAGTLAGLAGIACLATGAGGWWAALLTAGFAAPLGYLLFVLGVTATAAGKLRGRALAWLPVALTTMHVGWGTGFLTSSRRLVRDQDRRG